MLLTKIGKITCKIILPCFGCVLVLPLTVTVCADVVPTDDTSSAPLVLVEFIWITVKKLMLIEIISTHPLLILIIRASGHLEECYL